MMRAWIGVALLAVSWLLGTTVYLPADRLAWLGAIVGGTLLLGGVIRRGPSRRETAVALTLLLPAVWWAPWPLRAAPLLLAVGLAVELLAKIHLSRKNIVSGAMPTLAVGMSETPPERLMPTASMGMAPGHLNKAPDVHGRVRRIGRGAIAAGLVLLAQALAMGAYVAWTARSHELPRPLPETLAGVARLLGIEATADGAEIVMHSIRQSHRLAATWELLVDPASWCFLVGALVVLGLMVRENGRDEGVLLRDRLIVWGRAAGWLALAIILWLPVRAGLLMAVYLHRVLRSDYVLPLNVMDHFLSPWVLLLLLIPPVLLIWRFVRPSRGDDTGEATQEDASGDAPVAQAAATTEANADKPQSTKRRAWQFPAGVALTALAAGLCSVGLTWDPPGKPQGGRVMVVERHSTWEPTDRPYDTRWFGHDASYNYAAVFDYLDQYFEVSRLRESDRIDRATLDRCDVLVVKTPTARYGREEIDAVERFVERGGGLLLVGDHTNVFNSGTYLNDLARRFGFTFRHDLLFSTGESPYEQRYVPGRVPHPIVGHLPPTDLAVSCSIDPGRSCGRAVIRESGLWNMPPEYHIDNYHPYPQHVPEIRYGAFVQLWATRAGQGRVLAFGDSTIFSNFCAFQPGKAELLRGTIDWLNRRGTLDLRPWLLGICLLPLFIGIWLLRCDIFRVTPGLSGSASPGASTNTAGQASSGTLMRRPHNAGRWLVVLAACVCAWAVAEMAVAAAGRAAMPETPVRPNGRRPCVVVDRTTSRVPLSKGAFIQGDGAGYGLFEQWIARVAVPCDGVERNLWTTRRDGPDAFTGDAMVVICPDRPVSNAYRKRLVQYVADGGRLLILDSPENIHSTANGLLAPFGLSIERGQAWKGPLFLAGQWPGIQVPKAVEVAGGLPLARLGERAIAAMASPERVGKGRVMAVGFGSLLNDSGMGMGWILHPNAEKILADDTYLRYNVAFALVRALMTDRPVSRYDQGRVVLDRTLSRVFRDNGEALDEEQPSAESPAVAAHRFDRFEQWISRLGYQSARAGGGDSPLVAEETLSGDALVIVYPSEHIEADYRAEVLDYVAAGGRLLVVDSPDNPVSTANDLLRPLGLAFGEQPIDGGPLAVDTENGPTRLGVEPDSALPVHGGEPFAWIGASPVGATFRHGWGTVTLVGFGQSLDDAHMSPPGTGGPTSLAPHDVWSAVLRALMSDQAIGKTIPR